MFSSLVSSSVGKLDPLGPGDGLQLCNSDAEPPDEALVSFLSESSRPEDFFNVDFWGVMGAERGYATVVGERSAGPSWFKEELGFGPPLIGIYFLFGMCLLGGVWGIADFDKSPRAFG